MKQNEIKIRVDTNGGGEDETQKWFFGKTNKTNEQLGGWRRRCRQGREDG